MGALSDSLLGAIALSLILGFTVWSLAGWRSLKLSSAGHLFRRRNAQALVGLLPCLVLTLLASPGIKLMTGWQIGVSGAVAFLAFAAADPSRQGFWHHRRLRPIGVLVTLAVGVALGLYVPRVELIPVVFAAAIFHRHQRRTTALVTQCFEDVDGLRLKILTLEATAKGAVGGADLGRDIGTKAS